MKSFKYFIKRLFVFIIVFVISIASFKFNQVKETRANPVIIVAGVEVSYQVFLAFCAFMASAGIYFASETDALNAFETWALSCAEEFEELKYKVENNIIRLYPDRPPSEEPPEPDTGGKMALPITTDEMKNFFGSIKDFYGNLFRKTPEGTAIFTVSPTDSIGDVLIIDGHAVPPRLIGMEASTDKCSEEEWIALDLEYRDLFYEYARYGYGKSLINGAIGEIGMNMFVKKIGSNDFIGADVYSGGVLQDTGTELGGLSNYLNRIPHSTYRNQIYSDPIYSLLYTYNGSELFFGYVYNYVREYDVYNSGSFVRHVKESKNVFNHIKIADIVNPLVLPEINAKLDPTNILDSDDFSDLIALILSIAEIPEPLTDDEVFIAIPDEFPDPDTYSLDDVVIPYPDVYPGTDPDVDPGVDPDVDPDIDPDIDPDVDPDTDPKPEDKPVIYPGVDPGVNPDLPPNPDDPPIPDPDTDSGLWPFMRAILDWFRVIWRAIVSLPSMFLGLVVGTGGLDFEGLRINAGALADVFPFCIPFDFINAIESLVVSPKAPVYEMDFSGIPYFYGYRWRLDMSEYENLAVVVRFTVWVSCFIGLMISTKKFIGWE